MWPVFEGRERKDEGSPKIRPETTPAFQQFSAASAYLPKSLLSETGEGEVGGKISKMWECSEWIRTQSIILLRENNCATFLSENRTEKSRNNLNSSAFKV